MKKSLFTLASLAPAIALAFAFVACEQPVEEDAGAGSAAVLRLYIDRPDGLTLKPGDHLEIRAGQEIFVRPQGFTAKTDASGVLNYPYPMVLKPSTAATNKVPINKSVTDPSDPNKKYYKGWSGSSVTGTDGEGTTVTYSGSTFAEITAAVPNNKDRTKVIMIPPFRKNDTDGKITQPTGFAYPGLTATDKSPDEANAEPGSVIQSNNPKMKYLYSGIIALAVTTGTPAPGYTVAFDSKKNAYYIDIELLDKTPGSKGYDDFFKSSGSFYLELRVGNNVSFAANAAGGMLGYYYMYTPGKKGFNDFQGMTTGGIAVYKTDNANIKKFNLKPGINEISLSDFSFGGQHDVNNKVW
jgi:hypothetical protein